MLRRQSLHGRQVGAGVRGHLLHTLLKGRCRDGVRPARDRGQLRRSLWETALALAVRDALRSGDLHLPHSRQHAGFWSLVLDERLWASSRTTCYADLALTDQPADHLAQLAREIGSAATAFVDGLATNSFARIDQGQLSLSRPDAFTVTAELRSCAG